MDIQADTNHSITLHIGLMKTASTFLQHNVFPKFPGIVYLNTEKNLFNRTMIKSKGPVLVSNEDISGCPYLKEIDGLDYPGQFEQSLKNIKTIFNKPKLIICFREPSEMIQSYYKQYLHEGGTLTWNQFFTLAGDGIVKKEDFFFSNYLTLLKEMFSRDDLYIYTFDDFKQDPGKVAKNIYKFISGDSLPGNIKFDMAKRSNPSVKDDLEGLLIKLNRLNKTCKEKWGFRLQVKLFGKTLNPRVFCQYLLPKILKYQDSRDLTQIRSYYASDWKLVKQQIDELSNFS